VKTNPRAVWVSAGSEELDNREWENPVLYFAGSGVGKRKNDLEGREKDIDPKGKKRAQRRKGRARIHLEQWDIDVIMAQVTWGKGTMGGEVRW